MSRSQFTAHATTRCQQRGITRQTLSVLLEYGEQRYHRGAEVYFMDRAARARAKRALGRREFARVADRLGSYVVVSGDGIVITAGKRRGRLKF